MRLPVAGCGVKPYRSAFVIVLALALSGFSARGSKTVKFNSSHSTIAFQVRHLFGRAKGQFTKFSGTIDFDREHPEKSSVTATIQVVSIDTGIAKRDEHLRSADFFNVQKFPEIMFKSRRVVPTGADAGEIVGDLTMHGTTRPITLRAQLLGPKDGPATHWRVTTAPLKRSEFGLAWSKSVEAVSMIGDDVTVNIEIEAERAK